MAKDLSPSPPPLTPPLTEEVKLDWLRLLRSRRVGVTTFHRLIGEHGTAAAALLALPEVARAAGVDDYAPCDEDTARREVEAGHRAGARLVAMGEDDYPESLTDLPDAPPLLWLMGDAGHLRRPMVAIVGARNASSLGTRMAQRLAADLSDAGHVVVSGLARGIDTAAHLGALKGAASGRGGGTVAVFAGGVDVVYPAENAVLAQEIAERGLRISEMPINMAPRARHFPARNRIVSGLARSVVVVEAAAKSGSLITARNALDQGREVLAVPGHPFDARASGCNMLIRDGAVLVRNAADVVEAIARPELEAAAARPDGRPAIPPAAPETRTLAETAALHSQILDRLGPSPVAEDQLIRDLSRPAGEVAPALVTLELDGRIERRPGGLLSRVS